MTRKSVAMHQAVAALLMLVAAVLIIIGIFFLFTRQKNPSIPSKQSFDGLKSPQAGVKNDPSHDRQPDLQLLKDTPVLITPGNAPETVNKVRKALDDASRNEDARVQEYQMQ